MTARKAQSSKDMNGQKITNLGAPSAASSDAARKSDVEAAQATAVSRTNHTGTQLAATISDFDTQVRTNRLDQLAAPSGSVGLNAQKITSLGTPTLSTDAATMGYVDAQLAGLTSGQTLKGSVRAVSSTNVNLATPGTTIDGVTATNGDIFLLAGQTTGSQNGPYVFNGSAAAMTRATNWDVAGEAVLGSYWIVREGTQADKFALLTNDALTFGTTTPAFAYIGVAAAAATPFEQDLGNGAATSFAIAHNFATRNVHLQLRRNASPFEDVTEDTYYEYTDTNTVTVKPDVVWASNEFHAVVAKM